MSATPVIAVQTGLFVGLGLGALVFLTMQLPVNGLELFGSGSTYRVTAEFDDVGELKVGDPVTMAGVPVGRIGGISLDPVSFKAFVTMDIKLQYNRIPADSEASIDTVGLLGGQYVAIGPGRSQRYLRNGGRLESTQSAFVLENAVNRLFGDLAGRRG
jgi:phospholipid/cholesterol/gamma-HCH transport system substrate-binding protein